MFYDIKNNKIELKLKFIKDTMDIEIRMVQKIVTYIINMIAIF